VVEIDAINIRLEQVQNPLDGLNPDRGAPDEFALFLHLLDYLGRIISHTDRDQAAISSNTDNLPRGHRRLVAIGQGPAQKDRIPTPVRVAHLMHIAAVNPRRVGNHIQTADVLRIEPVGGEIKHIRLEATPDGQHAGFRRHPVYGGQGLNQAEDAVAGTIEPDALHAVIVRQHTLLVVIRPDPAAEMDVIPEPQREAFVLKEYFHRRRDANFDWHFIDPPRQSEAEHHAETFQREGIVLLPGYFKGEQLGRLQTAFGSIIDARPSPGNPDSFGNTDFMHTSPAFLEAALDDFLLEIIAGYCGRKFAIGRASALRILPTPANRYGSFMWHHDARGRQVHVMVLLTDVSADGQRMSYLRQSHLRYYDHYRGLAEGSRFEHEVVCAGDAKNRILEVTGPAGTVAIFDSNGLHSGNRNEVATRDTLTFCYVTKRHFKQIKVQAQDLDRLPAPKRDVVTFNPYHERLEAAARTV